MTPQQALELIKEQLVNGNEANAIAILEKYKNS